MGSGLNGQAFAFHGYLPIDKPKRHKMIQLLEEESSRKKQTQIIMETPHRNEELYKELLSSLKPSSLLCIANNLTSPDEFLQTKSVGNWKKEAEPGFNRKPTLFLFLSR
jgi:16S rRNA (cytidine1402-2'-O)-methyltransferase